MFSPMFQHGGGHVSRCSHFQNWYTFPCFMQLSFLASVSTVDYALNSKYYSFLGSDKSLVGPELDVSYVEFIKILNHEGKLQEASTTFRGLQLKDPTAAISSCTITMQIDMS